MTNHRNLFASPAETKLEPQGMSGFVLMTVDAGSPSVFSPLQQVYQQLYTQAMRQHQGASARDLFSVMN